MTRTIWLVSALAIFFSTSVRAQEPSSQGSTVIVDGETVRVRWSDGDSFSILEGPYQGHSVRLAGYNALESYGPVHRWGDWTAPELYEISRQATAAARREQWTCTTQGAQDHYQRVLITCDDLTLAMVSSGLGHLLYIDSTAPAEQIEAQQQAQTQGLGMWAKGVPDAIVTSLHSAAEEGEPYNRVISTADGSSEQVVHNETYQTCQEVCLRGSCLTYVPFEQRYGENRAECLRVHRAAEGMSEGLTAGSGEGTGEGLTAGSGEGTSEGLTAGSGEGTSEGPPVDR